MKYTWKFFGLCTLAILGYFAYRINTEVAPTQETKQAPAPDKKPTQSNEALQESSENPDEVAIPKKYQFIKKATPENFKTEEELRNSFSGSDRLVMDEFYSKFDQDAIAFNKPEQYDWLVKNGYPMPEDVVAGYKMSIDDLGKLVDQGNIKASYFYLMREIYKQNSGTLLDKLNKSGYDSEWSARYSNAEQIVMASGSPFVGYIFAARAAIDGKNPESVYAGYALASVMGDQRALNVLANAQNVDMRAFVSYLGTKMDMMRIANPNVFLGKPVDFPDVYSVGVRH
ncbi:hypothetical protein NLI96_g13138 [Meripilus lineatus]|uniref:Uncharacterized protein n=1 Tax=Meripilus lineatus TaxID=2056292 RepID=A0AAD5Y981_9APHY|nr:hypothetical protein NLI96_g13138 [Physisporinus lineatus]